MDRRDLTSTGGEKWNEARVYRRVEEIRQWQDDDENN